MTGETQILATPPLAPPSRAPAPAAPPVGGDPQVLPTVATSAASQAPSQPSFPVSLQFDQDTHRFFIEARDRASGLVVFQVPFKPVLPPSAASSSSAARGRRVDSKA